VQQGRLQEKENKLSKDDLLATLRFGADKIFRTKDSSSITDDDIDTILEEGRKKTFEMNSKLQTAEKGDMLDFSLDGGLSTQVFEGKDYSDRNFREGEAGISGVSSSSNFLFIDPGKRERKSIQTYSDAPAKVSRDEGVPKQRQLPRHLKLPKMDEWQFYDRVRLQEIQDEESRLWESMVERGDPMLQSQISKLVVLPPDLQEEKTALMAQAFGDWSRMHYSNFIKASAKYGRNNFEKIAEDVHRPVEEVSRYGSIFWTEGIETFSPSDWEKIVKQVEKGEKRLEEIDRLTDATGRLIGMFADPWEELCFRHVGAQGRVFHSIEDRYLLCLTHVHGYGNWDRVRSSIRRCERFRFDYFLLSCSAEILGKRCESLMRMAEKELAEMDKKKSVATSSAAAEGSATAAAATATSSVGMRERLTELSKHIAEEARRLALTRGELLKAKGGSSVSAIVATDGGSSAAAGPSSSSKQPKPAAKPRASTDGKEDSKGASVHSGRPPKNLASENLPELARIIIGAGGDGMMKIVEKFLEAYPDVPKRAIENKVFEISTKEKRGADATKVDFEDALFLFLIYLLKSVRSVFFQRLCFYTMVLTYYHIFFF
jgi:SWI/SNF-related matrix-associated actin-dependent regulator of chromatin subfamily A member 5